MLSNAINQIAVQRARMARDIEYIRESTKDIEIMEAIFIAEAGGSILYGDGSNIGGLSRKEVSKAIQQFTESDDDSENQEIQRILSSTKSTMTLDEVLGLESAEEVIDKIHKAYLESEENGND